MPLPPISWIAKEVLFKPPLGWLNGLAVGWTMAAPTVSRRHSTRSPAKARPLPVGTCSPPYEDQGVLIRLARLPFEMGSSLMIGVPEDQAEHVISGMAMARWQLVSKVYWRDSHVRGALQIVPPKGKTLTRGALMRLPVELGASNGPASALIVDARPRLVIFGRRTAFGGPEEESS